ncbi:MAG: type I-A CRISPR-associated protein Cas5 [Thermoproteota archaeon]|jgi:CRISPR-associated protein Cas5a/b/c|uniref:Type I-A CRISPR-associated protein Cas5 n=1 Tax=Candidatus Methanodesulfokora washburnensis TaxID=2478471 RepID=A0A3R9PCE9_9CREN|nr:type I-A CRISPR-associated protein Cas5a [Candidatus Methanodesulfokores washburnensis]RSN72531.1 type I-A CRISPR-associated protein Cas5 [Candidatus Methanodesulfokores washburnensis]TDA40735.1 MAG: type I-A CRISPR-associated protein Cas5 [Candidatus Korarchaeota archaeon]
MLYAVKAILELHWGYSVKRPVFSASQPALLIPPPTSLLGALARAVAYFKEWPETIMIKGKLYSSASLLIQDVPWTALALADERFIGPILGLIETRDMIRALIAPYQRREHAYPGSRVLFGVQPHGKIYAPSMHLYVIYFTRTRDIEKYIWSITSLGNKESTVSVSDVRIAEVELNAGDNEIETLYCFPSSLGEVIEGKFLKEVLSKPSLEHYELGVARDLAKNWEEFVIPLTQTRVRLHEGAVAVRVNDETVIVPQEVIKNE